MDYHLTQAMSEHGCFGAYLLRIKKEPTGGRLQCGAEVDDAGHTLFVCTRWATERTRLQDDLDSVVNASNMVELMLSSKEAWNTISEFIRCTMSLKEEEGRRREVSG